MGDLPGRKGGAQKLADLRGHQCRFRVDGQGGIEHGRRAFEIALEQQQLREQKALAGARRGLLHRIGGGLDCLREFSLPEQCSSLRGWHLFSPDQVCKTSVPLIVKPVTSRNVVETSSSWKCGCKWITQRNE